MVEMRMLGGLWRCMITVGVLVMAQPVSAQDCDKNILLAAVLGTFFATVVAALLITLIVFLACRHSNKVRTRGNTMGKVKQAGRPNKRDLDQCNLAGKRADTVEVAWIPASKPRFAAADYIQNGYAGYVPCQENAVVNVQDETTFESVQQAGQPLFSTPTYSAACTRLPKDEICSKTPDRGHSDLPPSRTIRLQLRGHDGAGLGFNISTGSDCNGIFVSQVHERGPAHDSGLVHQGDRIMYLGISFEHISFEDALTILSYASPYLVNMELRAPIGSPALVHTKADSELDGNIVRATAEAPPSCSKSNIGKLVFHPRWKSRSQENLVSMNYITANGGQIDPAVADDVIVKRRRTWSDWRGRIKLQLVTREDNERMVKEWQRQESLVTQVSPNDVITRANFNTAHAVPSALNNTLVADSNARKAKKDEAVEIIIEEKEVIERVEYSALTSDNSIHQRQSDSPLATDKNKSLDISSDETDHGLTNGDKRDSVRDHIRDLEELSRSKLAQKMRAISASYSWIDSRAGGQRQTHDSRPSRTQQQQQQQHERASVTSSYFSTRSSGSLTEPAVAVGDKSDRTVVISSGMLSPAKRRKMNGSSLPDVIDDSEESWRNQLDMAEQLARERARKPKTDSPLIKRKAPGGVAFVVDTGFHATDTSTGSATPKALAFTIW